MKRVLRRLSVSTILALLNVGLVLVAIDDASLRDYGRLDVWPRELYSAALGTLLDLKPILTETLEGKLAAAGKVRGRRKAMSYILEKAVENVADQKEAMGIILHADAMDDAQKLRQMLVEKLPEMDIRIYPVGPVIGTHAGPGTIAFCFLGKKREI